MTTRRLLQTFSVAALLGSILLGGCAPSKPQERLILSQDPLPLLEVLGAENQISAPEWADARLGMGVAALLQEALYSTGKFRMAAQDSVSQAQRANLAAQMWAGLVRRDSLASIPTSSANPDYQTWVQLISFGRPRSGVDVGVLHTNKQKAVLTLEVIIRQSQSGKIWRARGTGEAATTATSALFQYRENRLDLDQSLAGGALRLALQEALKNLGLIP